MVFYKYLRKFNIYYKFKKATIFFFLASEKCRVQVFPSLSIFTNFMESKISTTKGQNISTANDPIALKLYINVIHLAPLPVKQIQKCIVTTRNHLQALKLQLYFTYIHSLNRQEWKMRCENDSSIYFDVNSTSHLHLYFRNILYSLNCRSCMSTRICCPF